MNNDNNDRVSENSEQTSVRQDRETAEYPAVNALGRMERPTESVGHAVAIPPYVPADVHPLETLQGFASVRVMHARSGAVVQEAYSSFPADDIDDNLVASLRELGRSASFESLGMVTKEHLTLVHSLHSRVGFICILALKQSTGNFALAKIQIQRVFATPSIEPESDNE